MYLASVSVRRVDYITEVLWGSKVSPSTISEINKKVYALLKTVATDRYRAGVILMSTSMASTYAATGVVNLKM